MAGRSVVCACFMLVLVSCLVPLTSHGQETITYDGTLLTIKAIDAPLVPLLEEIAAKTGVVIFISKEIEPSLVSANFVDITPEKAFKRLLKDHNVVMIFNRVGDDFVVNALKIFPAGKDTGEMDVIVAGRNLDATVEDAVQDTEGVHPILPASHAKAMENDNIAPAALAYAREEKKQWEEIAGLKQEIAGQVDEEKKQVLSMALLTRLEQFEDMQKNHRSILEVDSRLEHFNQTMGANQDNVKKDVNEE